MIDWATDEDDSSISSDWTDCEETNGLAHDENYAETLHTLQSLPFE